MTARANSTLNRIELRTLLMVAGLLTVALAGSVPADDRPFGIESRAPWVASQFKGTPEPPAPYLIEPAFAQPAFQNPVELVAVPGTNELAVLELAGKLWVFDENDTAGERSLAADLQAGIEGMTRAYGLVFHPDFQTNRTCFISYVLNEGNPEGTRVSRFRAASVSPLKLDLASEEIVITWLSGGHNGGSLQFGPRDGLLYISTGDGSPPFPPDMRHTGQDISDLLASVLRIDVDRREGDRPYAIPADNPFVNTPGARSEVWTLGHRNPWKMSFDPDSGELWIGDVGWEMWEMIYRASPGANFGWSLLEHTQPVNPDLDRGPTLITPPAAAHSHTESRSITGGHVYRGDRLPDLAGTYVYGDYVTGRIWGLDVAMPNARPRELALTPLQIICFGIDHAGELLVVGYDGTLHRLVPNPSAGQTSEFPRLLSRTGLFQSVAEHVLSEGVIPYAVNAEPWADGTTATRFIALPGSSTLGVHEANNVQKGLLRGEWSYPEGAILGKTISLPGLGGRQQRLETQILYQHNQEWRAYSYHWNAEQTDAELSDGGGSDRTFAVPDKNAPGEVRQQTWHFSSQTECLLCHSSRGGSVYGFKREQLNRNFDYHGVTDNQLRTMAHIGLFDEPLVAKTDRHTAPLDQLPRMTDPADASATLTDRVRSYLHVNCSHCHQRGGGGTAAIEVPVNLPFERTRLISKPTQGTFGIVDGWVVAPGAPERSVLFYRMAKIGRGRMPHFGSQTVDAAGLRLIHDWIAELDVPEVAAPGANESESTAPSADAVRLTASNTDSIVVLCDATADDTATTAAVQRLLASTSGAIRLSAALRGFGLPGGRSLNAAARNAAIAAGAAHPETPIRDLFEVFLPEEARARRLGTQIDREALLAMTGDAGRGRDLFLNAAGLQCRNCHRVGETGKAVGPDLTGIGQRMKRHEILENIVEPSRRIDEKYQTWLLETSAGRVYSGLLIERASDSVVLRDATGKDIRVARSDVELLVAQQKSLMPELLLRDVTPQDAADLLAWLESLRP